MENYRWVSCGGPRLNRSLLHKVQDSSMASPNCKRGWKMSSLISRRKKLDAGEHQRSPVSVLPKPLKPIPGLSNLLAAWGWLVCISMYTPKYTITCKHRGRRFSSRLRSDTVAGSERPDRGEKGYVFLAGGKSDEAAQRTPGRRLLHHATSQWPLNVCH